MSLLYEQIARPLLFSLSPETAHDAGMFMLRHVFGSEPIQDLAAKKLGVRESILSSRVFGLDFANPLGVAAGFDKNGRVVDQLAALGFGFVEVGTVTFEAQPGNPKPRLFRLPEDQALINRLGFNNEGTPRVVERLRRLRRKCVVGINIGRNKSVANDDAIENYLKSFDLAAPVADYVAVNVSSPNTPNLRELQKAENLEDLLGELQKRNIAFGDGSKPLLVKIAPDLDEDEIEKIVDIVQRLGLAGIIATNTTISREGLKTKIDETGGLSGRPVASMSNKVIEKIYRCSKGTIPVVGVGGIFNANDAFEKIASGASLVQAYTGFVYGGITFARDINLGLAAILRQKGFSRIDDAVGSSVVPKSFV